MPFITTKKPIKQKEVFDNAFDRNLSRSIEQGFKGDAVWNALTTAFDTFLQGASKKVGELGTSKSLLLPHNQAKAAGSLLAAPFKTTAGLLTDFGKDVVGMPGGMWDKRAAQTERYGPIASSIMGGVEGATKGAEVAAAGAMAGKLYTSWEQAGKPMGLGTKDVTKHSKPQTQAEKIAAYRVESGQKFNSNDQWDTYKEGVIRDLRRQGVPETSITQIRDLPRALIPREKFSKYLYQSTQLPAKVKPILEAWQNEITNAHIQYQHLSAGRDFTWVEGRESPVAKMERSIFATNRAAAANDTVAEQLREAARLYSESGEVWKAKAYERAADLVTSKGAPNLIKLMEKGGASAIQDAYKGQGGIGSGISQRIEDFLSTGEFSVSATTADMAGVPQRFMGPGAMSVDDLADDIDGGGSVWNESKGTEGYVPGGKSPYPIADRTLDFGQSGPGTKVFLDKKVKDMIYDINGMVEDTPDDMVILKSQIRDRLGDEGVHSSAMEEVTTAFEKFGVRSPKFRAIVKEVLDGVDYEPSTPFPGPGAQGVGEQQLNGITIDELVSATGRSKDSLIREAASETGLKPSEVLRQMEAPSFDGRLKGPDGTWEHIGYKVPYHPKARPLR